MVFTLYAQVLSREGSGGSWVLLGSAQQLFIVVFFVALAVKGPANRCATVGFWGIGVK